MMILITVKLKRVWIYVPLEVIFSPAVEKHKNQGHNFQGQCDQTGWSSSAISHLTFTTYDFNSVFHMLSYDCHI